MTLFERPLLYSKIDKEDKEEVCHRRAKFLIYKTLQEVDMITRRSPPSFLRLKFYGLKVKIGHGLTNLRQSVVSAVRFGGIRKHSQGGLRALKNLFHFHGGATTGLPRPVFNLQV